MYTKILSENLKQSDCLGNPGIGGKIILKWVLKETWYEDVDCMQLAQ
jgi:hypothetical protein